MTHDALDDLEALDDISPGHLAFAGAVRRKGRRRRLVGIVFARSAREDEDIEDEKETRLAPVVAAAAARRQRRRRARKMRERAAG